MVTVTGGENREDGSRMGSRDERIKRRRGSGTAMGRGGVKHIDFPSMIFAKQSSGNGLMEGRRVDRGLGVIYIYGHQKPAAT